MKTPPAGAFKNNNISWREFKRKYVVNNIDMSRLVAPWHNNNMLELIDTHLINRTSGYCIVFFKLCFIYRLYLHLFLGRFTCMTNSNVKMHDLIHTELLSFKAITWKNNPCLTFNVSQIKACPTEMFKTIHYTLPCMQHRCVFLKSHHRTYVMRHQTLSQ